MEIDTSGLLETLESFAQDPNGSISGLLSRLVSLGDTPSGMGVVPGVVRYGHNPPAACGHRAEPSN